MNLFVAILQLYHRKVGMLCYFQEYEENSFLARFRRKSHYKCVKIRRQFFFKQNP